MPPSIHQPRIGLVRAQSGAHRLRGYVSLTKPRVVTTALWRRYSDKLARATFRYSIAYLTLLFAALLVDHYL
jgi:heme O synthase-like polyprenyltransferase